MDRFETLRLYTRIVELGSFTRAAAELRVPRASATHAIKALEHRLGTRLLERTTRHVRVTADGRAYHEACAHLLAELEQVESGLSGQRREPCGVLRVDLRGAIAARLLLPQIDDFCARYPRVELVVSNGERLADLLRDGVDCLVCPDAPHDAPLGSQWLADLPQVICASPAYLQRAGEPHGPGDLPAHAGIGWLRGQRDGEARISIGAHESDAQAYVVRRSVSVSDGDSYLLCALRGCGLAQWPRAQVETHLRDGSLVEVLRGFASPPVRVVLWHPVRPLAPAARAFVDWAMACGAMYRDAAAAAAPVG